MVNRPGKNSEKLQRGVAHTPLSPLVRSMVYKIAFPMNGFFIGRKFECVKRQNFYINKTSFYAEFLHKKTSFYRCIFL